jgi:hypothetical protein
MSALQQLVSRGTSVIREWHNYDGMDHSIQKMISALSANALTTLCDLQKMSTKEREDKANFIRIALTTAFQIGRTTRPQRIRQA